MSKDAWIESRARYQEVLVSKPSQAKAVNGLQRVFALEGNYEASLHWTGELLKMVETDIIYFQAKLDLPGITEAEEADLRSRMANTFDLAERSHMLAATMLHEMGRSEDALAHLTSAAEIVPRSSDVWSHRAQILLDLNLYEASIEAVDQFLRLSTEDFDHPDIQAGYDLKSRAQEALDNSKFEASLLQLKASTGS